MRIATNFLAVVLVLVAGTTVGRAQITGGRAGVVLRVGLLRILISWATSPVAAPMAAAST